MFDSVTIEDAESVDDAVARQLLAAFDLPQDPVSLLRVRTLLRKKARFGGPMTQVESQQFLHRVAASGHELSLRAKHEDAGRVPRDLASVPRYRWTKSYMPRRLKADLTILVNMRLENCGQVPLYCSETGRIQVSARWQNRDGTPVDSPEQRTPLPIDVNPGKALTIAVRVTPPARSGSYLLSLTLVQEQIRWLDADTLTTSLSVVDEIAGPVPDGWVLRPEAPASYEADHDIGCALLIEWLREHAPVQPRVLEVGGNAVPMLSRLGSSFGTDLVNIDVDLLGLQIGGMLTRNHGIPVRHFCADAFDLPFASRYFDAIIIFASLHHFPDPAALLANLRHKLRPNGFIGLFCEPVGHVWPGAILPSFLEELKRGVNEQSFSLPEYALMFRQAELLPAEVFIDSNSLKARLIHDPADGTA